MFKNKVSQLIIENRSNSNAWDLPNNVAKSLLINAYLNALNVRLGSRRYTRVRLFGRFLACIYTLIIIYNAIGVFVDVPYETRVLLFDLSLVMGGIAKYMHVLYVCSFCIGIALNSRIRLTVGNAGIDVWTQMFILMRTRVRLISKSVDKQIIDKLIIFTKRIYKGLNVSIPCYGK